MTEKKKYSFDQLYKQHKKNHRGLDPNPKRRGRENPYIRNRAQNVLEGKSYFKGFPLIVLAMAYPTSLNNSFKGMEIGVEHWVKRYA